MIWRTTLATHISAHYMSDSFGQSLSDAQAIELFRDRAQSWQIDIAAEMVRRPGCVPENNAMRHAGYALISVLFSYFEMIAQYERGQSSDVKETNTDWGSKRAFRDGFRSVYPGPNF